MNDVVAPQFVAQLLRTTLMLAAAAAVVGLLLRVARVSSPAVHRAGCVLALVIGWSFLRVPLVVPWYQPAAQEVVESAPLPPVPFPDLKDLEQAELASAASAESLVGWPLEGIAGAPRTTDDLPPETLPRHAAPQALASPERDESSVAASFSASGDDDWTSAAAAPPLAAATARGVLSIWLAGMGAIVCAWLAGYVRFVRRLPVGQAADDAWLAEWRELLARRGIARAIPLRVTAESGPMLCRLPRGYELLVPASLWQALSPNERACILRHELAHFERGDVWKSLAVRLLALPHWFNPAAWWAVRHFDEAAEWACDRAAAGNEPVTAYAKALLRLGEASTRQASYSPGARGRTLSRRIRRVLTRGPHDDSWTKKLVFALAALAIGAAALVRIELVAKEPAEPAIADDESVTMQPTEAPRSVEFLANVYSYDQDDGWRGLAGLAEQQGDTFQLTADELQRRQLRVAIARPVTPDKLVLHGQTVVDQGRMVFVSVPVAAEVISLGPRPDQPEANQPERHPTKSQFGEKVKSGQVLATLWSKELAEKKGELFDVTAELRLDEQALARLKDLAARGATSGQALREAEKQVADRKVAVNKVQRTLQAWRVDNHEIENVKAAAAKPADDQGVAKQQVDEWGKLMIVSPMDGVIVERNINVGDVIEPPIKAFKIADLRHLGVFARLFEEDIARLNGVPADSRVWTIQASVLPTLPKARGTFESVGETIDPVEHTVAVVGQVENEDGQLRAGMNVTATIDIRTDATFVEMPSTAVVHDGDWDVAFVGATGQANEFQRRKISIVRRFGDSVWVRSTPGDAEKERGISGINAGDNLLAQVDAGGESRQPSTKVTSDAESLDDRVDKNSKAGEGHRAHARQLLCSSARKAYGSSADDYLHGNGPLERVYDWSKIWMTAEADPAVAPSARVGAREMHLERMKNLHEVCKARVKANEEQKFQLDKTEYYVREAEQLLDEGDADDRSMRRALPQANDEQPTLAARRELAARSSAESAAAEMERSTVASAKRDPREALRYDGKSFADWVEVLERDLSRERKVEAMRALAAFGAHGYAQETISQILSGVREHDAPPDDAIRALSDLGRRSPALTAELEKAAKQDNPPESNQLLSEALTLVRQPNLVRAPIATSSAAASAAPRTSTTAESLSRKEQALKRMIEERTELLIRAKKEVDSLQKSLGILDPSEAFQQKAMIQTQLGGLNTSIISQTADASNLEMKIEDFKLEIALAQDPQTKEVRAEGEIEKDQKLKDLEKELRGVEMAIADLGKQVKGKDSPAIKRIEAHRNAVEDKIAARRDELMKRFSDSNEAIKIKELQGKLASAEKHRDSVNRQLDELKEQRTELTQKLDIITRDTAELDTRKQNLRVTQEFLDELTMRLNRLQLEKLEFDLDQAAQAPAATVPAAAAPAAKPVAAAKTASPEQPTPAAKANN